MSEEKIQMKLTAEELETVQNLNQQFVQTKVAIADAAVQQTTLMNALESIQNSFNDQEKVLAEKYGKNATINLKDGTVTQPEDKE
tara:strand:- start:9164 stop:9418 length:255 start_codon:yes stop_codon:yes gene_type:complete